MDFELLSSSGVCMGRIEMGSGGLTVLPPGHPRHDDEPSSKRHRADLGETLDLAESVEEIIAKSPCKMALRECLVGLHIVC